MAELITRAPLEGMPAAAPVQRPGASAAAAMDTLSARLRQRANGHGTQRAFLQKRHGVWDAWTWSRVDATVDALAGALRAAGLARGEAVGIASGARIEAVIAVYACQRCALLPVLLNPNLPSAALGQQAEQAQLVAIVAEDQEQVDKVADAQSRLPALRSLWVIDPKGTGGYRHVRAQPLRPLMEPPLHGAAPPEAAASHALGLFSAGVHAEPRLVRVTHATVLHLASACDALGLAAGERCASLFGLADPLGHFFSVAAPVLCGSVACFGEARVPSLHELRQCTPRVIAMPARLLDQLRREAAVRANRASGLRRALLQRWHAVARPSRALHALVGRPVANALGIGDCRLLATGYERMAPASARLMHRLGIRTCGLYGVAEAAGPMATFEQAEQPALELLAPWPPRVDAEGRLALDVDGERVQTGDLVTLDGGRLHLVGRAADLLALPDGSAIAPAVIEAELMACPWINQAVAVGGPATGVSVLVELDEVTLRDWARAHGLSFTTLRSLSQSTQVRALVDDAVAEANQRLPPAARIARTVVLPRALEVANGELTPALALRRAIVRNRYAHLLSQGNTP